MVRAVWALYGVALGVIFIACLERGEVAPWLTWLILVAAVAALAATPLVAPRVSHRGAVAWPLGFAAALLALAVVGIATRASGFGSAWCFLLAVGFALFAAARHLQTGAPRAIDWREGDDVLERTLTDPSTMTTRELLAELADDARLLLKRQVALVEVEARAQARRGKTMLELFGTAGALAVAGLMLLLVAAALGLGVALGHNDWLGALVLGGFLLVTAVGIAPVGWSKRVAPLQRSRRELEKEIAWAKHRVTT